jgi:membrane protease YdiL (CAAX protease family)
MLHTTARGTARPPRTEHPARQVAVYLGITYGLALAIALALPHAGIAPLISILVPITSVALTVLLTVPRGARRREWSAVGFGLPGGLALVVAVVGPVLIIGLSFGVAVLLGVVRFPAPDGSAGAVLRLVLATAVFAVVFLGEEVGWRGFLMLRLAELTSGRRAAVLTGACHAVFHLPLLVLTTTYQSAGNRWIVVPMVMVTLTMAGVWYGWLRAWSGSIWPVSLSHSAFNNVVETFGGAAIATSPATMAYVTTETGAATLVIVSLVAAYLLVRRAADFERACPAVRVDPGLSSGRPGA